MRISSYRRCIWASLVMTLAGIGIARAGAINVKFDLSNGDHIDADFTLATADDPTNPGYFKILSITGSDGINNIVLDPTLIGHFPNSGTVFTDNLFNPSGTASGDPSYVTGGGFAYEETQSGGDKYAFFWDNTAHAYEGCWVNGGGCAKNEVLVVTNLVVSPEPSCIYLIGTGFLGVALLRRRKLRKRC